MPPSRTVLAADVGGTKIVIGLYADDDPRPKPVVVARYATADYTHFSTVLAEFVRDHAASPVDAAAIGVAGPVRDGRCQLTNVPWLVDRVGVAAALELAPTRVALLNDVEAMGHAVTVLTAEDRVTLQDGRPNPTGNAALIAPGTGLGESMLLRIDGRLHPTAGEPGHADFAARTPREISLLQALTDTHGRASCEDVLSGPGLVRLHEFTHTGASCDGMSDADATNPQPEMITATAAARRCPRCEEAVALFVAALGAEAGNLALRSLATAGVYLAGGIVPHLIDQLRSDGFLRSFRTKGPMAGLLEDVPIHVVVAEHAALLGAAVVASRPPAPPIV